MRFCKARFGVVASMMAFSLAAACSPQPDATVSANMIEEKRPSLDNAKAVADAFKLAKLPIVDVKELSETTDDNHLLGRPGQYTSKLFFYDARHPKSADSEGENTIEVFLNPIDAKRRHDYIAEITGGVGMLTQYQILRGPILVRLDKVILPSEAKAYESALDAALR